MTTTHHDIDIIQNATHAGLPPHDASFPEKRGIIVASDNARATSLAMPTLALSVAIIAWAMVNLANGWVGFAAVVPVGFRGGGEAAISLARLFAALVQILIVADRINERLRWAACGFVVLGLGQLIFGYIAPIVQSSPRINDSLYQMILVRSLAGALMVAGLVPRQAPHFSLRTAMGVVLISVLCSFGYVLLKDVNR
jgi:hypothetical protein